MTSMSSLSYPNAQFLRDVSIGVSLNRLILAPMPI
jgi:hypothetical protein